MNKTNQNVAMTRKEAHAMPHKFSDAVSSQWFQPGASPESTAFFKEEMQAAFCTLDIAVHGKRASCTGFFGLCRICYLRYISYTVLLRGMIPPATPRSRRKAVHSC